MLFFEGGQRWLLQKLLVEKGRKWETNDFVFFLTDFEMMSVYLRFSSVKPRLKPVVLSVYPNAPPGSALGTK